MNRQHVYTTLNRRIKAAWQTIAPETVPAAVVNGPPRVRFPCKIDPQGELPAEYLRVYWFGQGRRWAPGWWVTTVQMDLQVLDDKQLAATKADALLTALGLDTNAPAAYFQACDHTSGTPVPIGQMQLLADGVEWLDLSPADDRVIRKVCRFSVAWAY